MSDARSLESSTQRAAAIGGQGTAARLFRAAQAAGDVACDLHRLCRHRRGARTQSIPGWRWWRFSPLRWALAPRAPLTCGTTPISTPRCGAPHRARCRAAPSFPAKRWASA